MVSPDNIPSGTGNGIDTEKLYSFMIIALLLIIIAVCIYIAWKISQNIKNKTAKENSIFCNHCGKPITKDSKFCNFCGKEIEIDNSKGE